MSHIQKWYFKTYFKTYLREIRTNKMANLEEPTPAFDPNKKIEYDDVKEAFEAYKKDNPPKEPDPEWDEHVKQVVEMVREWGEHVPGAWSDALRDAGF